MDMSILGVLFLGVVAVVAVFICSVQAKEKEKLETIEKRKAEVQSFIAEVNEKRQFSEVNTQLILKSGEKALLSEASSLYETRAIRHSTGGAVRLAKGVYVGESVSSSSQELKNIDSGVLTLTSLRIVFDGGKENRSVSLNKIISVSRLFDGIEISIENRQKSQTYAVKNPLLWETLIGIIPQINDFNNIPVLRVRIE